MVTSFDGPQYINYIKKYLIDWHFKILEQSKCKKDFQKPLNRTAYMYFPLFKLKTAIIFLNILTYDLKNIFKIMIF